MFVVVLSSAATIAIEGSFSAYDRHLVVPIAQGVGEWLMLVLLVPLYWPDKKWRAGMRSMAGWTAAITVGVVAVTIYFRLG
ncbi:MAG TPA: hypothetical protein VH583_08485 [Vicinamibacterales bacterium]